MGRECGHRSLSTGRVSVDMGAFPRGESAWTREGPQGFSMASVMGRPSASLALVSFLYIQSTGVKKIN